MSIQESNKLIAVHSPYEKWKAELIRITAEKTGTPEHEIKINDKGAREWYDAGVSPYFTFRETWGGE